MSTIYNLEPPTKGKVTILLMGSDADTGVATALHSHVRYRQTLADKRCAAFRSCSRRPQET